MMLIGSMTKAAALSAAMFASVFAGRGTDALQAPQDLAGRLSGTWVVNRELSTGFGPAGPGRGRGGQPGRQPPGVRFATAAAAQRGGGGGRAGASDPSDLTPAQRAEQAALRQLQQIAERITIKASADAVTFTDVRGERTFLVNDKTSTIDVGGSPVKVKSKWDKQALKQEFSNGQAKFVQTWSLDAADHLVLTAKVESLTLLTPDRKAVFDRQ